MSFQPPLPLRPLHAGYTHAVPFAVDDCSQMVAGGADPLAVAAYLYGVELETGKLFGKKVPLCSMEPGPKTNPQQCPWSIELA